MNQKNISNSYNLFNSEMVDYLINKSIKSDYCSEIQMEKFIIELIKYYALDNYCYNISFNSNNNYCFGYYNYYEKQLFINYKKIMEFMEKISKDQYFINANIYRIILHEIKHIIQHKMVNDKNEELFKIFDYEFNNANGSLIKPSEVNADIESSLILIKNYDKNHILYNNQLVFTINLINSFFNPICIVNDYCCNNKIKLSNVNSIDEFIYGLDNKIIFDNQAIKTKTSLCNK